MKESDSFTRWLIKFGSRVQPIDNLSPELDKHLNGWVRGLFEVEGITDDLISECPPQDFYRIAATLFDQMVIACREAALPFDKIRNGLECKFRGTRIIV